MTTQKTAIKIGLIGGGNMAQAIISGLLSSGFLPTDIIVSDPVALIRKSLEDLGVRTTVDNNDVLAFTNDNTLHDESEIEGDVEGVIILAIKPQMFEGVLSPLAGRFNNQLVLSIAAGTSIDTIATLIKHDKIVRAMPNTPALLQEGATGIYAPNNIDDMEKATCEVILAATGIVIWVDSEDKLHAVTAVSGSAPAYFFYMMEAMIAKGQELGLTREQANDLTLQTALGAAKMAIDSADSPSVLRQKVTSPNGTTHEAIESFKANGLDSVIAKGMQACMERSIEMAKANFDN